MARTLCSSCGQPLATCLCQFISSAQHSTSIIIIQCGKESQHPKNTANLLPLLSEHITLVQAADVDTMSRLRNNIESNPNKYALLFPIPESQSIEEYVQQNTPKIEVLLVIDGTWRKAKRFFYENEWLQPLSALCLSREYDSQYAIRKTSVTNGLSTLEAIAYSLNELEKADVKPFLQLLNGINTVFTQRMPSDVKARYK